MPLHGTAVPEPMQAAYGTRFALPRRTIQQNTFMKTSVTRLLFVLATISVLASCKKYEDGPLISLRSREARIANDWRIERAMDGGDDVTGLFDQYELRLTKGKDATLTANYTLLGIHFEFSTSGTWALVNKSEDLQLDFADDDADETWEILRLKETELWLHEKGGDLELHLVPI
jgi:hypothetical protein